VADMRLHIEAQEATVGRIQKFLGDGTTEGDPERIDGFKKRLAGLQAEIKSAKAVLDKAEDLPRRVKIACQMQRNPEPGQILHVETKPGEDNDAQDGKIRILLHFGVRTAVCTLDPKDFRS
jgi:hypothetical protein